MLFGAYRKQRNLTLSVIGCSAFAAALGVFFTHRAVTRERHLNALKSQFISSVSHEIRVPVASMRLMAEGLAAGNITKQKVSEFHGLLAREGARLASLIENILDFARIEQGRKSYTFTEADIESLTKEAVNLLRPQAEAKCQGLTTQTHPFSVDPVIDGMAVQQAMINLIDNAITVTLKPVENNEQGEAGEDRWIFSVEDEGPGISAGERERVFERFVRLENELRRETQGAGIGLSLVKHVVEAHGGSVRVKNGADKGCLFSMELPVSCK